VAREIVAKSGRSFRTFPTSAPLPGALSGTKIESGSAPSLHDRPAPHGRHSRFVVADVLGGFAIGLGMTDRRQKLLPPHRSTGPMFVPS